MKENVSLLRSPSHLWEEYGSASSDKKVRIWSEVKNMLYKGKNPASSVLAALLLFDERDPVTEKEKSRGITERIREIFLDKQADIVVRKVALDFLRLKALKEDNPEDNLLTFDSLYRSLDDNDELMEIKMGAGDALIQMGAKWLTRRIMGPEKLLSWLEEKREEGERLPFLSQVIARWEREFRLKKPVAALLLSLMDTYSFLNTDSLWLFLKGIEDVRLKSRLSIRWREITLERLQKLREGKLSADDVKDVSREVSFRELQKGMPKNGRLSSDFQSLIKFSSQYPPAREHKRKD